MEQNTKRKIGIGLCITVIVLGLVSLVLYAFDFDQKIRLWLNSDETQTLEQTESEQADAPVSVSGPQSAVSAVWLEKETDFADMQVAQSAMTEITQMGFNTVIISGCDETSLPELVSYARSAGLYSIAFLSPADFITGGLADAQKALNILSAGMNSVLLDYSSGCSDHEVTEAVRAIRQVRADLYLGIYSKSETVYKPLFAENIFNYKYIDIFTPTKSVNGDYIQYLSHYIDSVTQDTIFGIRLELIGNAQGYEKPEEIISQYDSVSMTDSYGCGFYRFDFLKKNKDGIADAILEFMSTGIKKDFFKELVISKPTKTTINTDESKISFVGTADISHELTFNGEKVEMIDDGYFAFDVSLNPGENVFTFVHKGKTQVYKVNYEMELIRSVQPTGTVNAPGGAGLDITVVALKSATVTAQINGSSVFLVRSDDYSDEAADDNSDYTYFIGSYTLPQETSSVQKLGKISVTAVYEGVSQTQAGAAVNVNAATPVIQPEVTETTTLELLVTTTQTTVPSSEESSQSSEEDSSSQPTSSQTQTTETTTQKEPEEKPYELLTPHKNNGVSGRSRMIVVKADYAETFPNTTTNDISVPYFTPLPEGTVDYVTGTLSYGEFNYYVLKSGRRVYQKDVEYLSSGYNMPLNSIKTVNVKRTTSATNITFSTRWKVPFNIREYPQQYYTQTAGRPYSVASFTAEYVDIVFYHTSQTDTAPQFNSDVISKVEWIKSNDSCTLRLHLKKPGGFYGIKYYYNSDGTLTFSIKERKSSAIAGKVIMLDAGHGGNDPGAIGTAIVGSKNVYESTINLSIANKMKAKLEALGATVIMTRTSAGQTISLESRAAACRSKNPDVFISIHCDASESQSPSGTTAYYYKSYAYPLANSLNKGIVSAYKNSVYASNATMASKVDKGSAFKGFKVTRVEECPAVLIEFGYVTNVTECNALIKDSTQEALAQGAVNGLVSYFKNS